MDKEQLTRILLILLIILATLFLAQMLWQLLSGYADLILLFVLGWLVSFVLNPVVTQLTRPVPHVLKPGLESAVGSSRATVLLRLRFSRGVAVIIVYVGLALLIVISIALIVPTAVTQLSQLANRLPEYVAQAPVASVWVEDQIARFGVHVNVANAMRSGLNSLQTYAASLIQNALSIFSGVLNFITNLFFVLILGFIFTLDMPRLRKTLLRLIPRQYLNEFQFFSASVDRTFGGFIRGQLLQAVLVALGTAVAMTVLGLNFVLIASLFAGLLMVIPLVGPFLALVPPILAVLLQSPDLTIWLFLALFIYQFVITNVLMPRVLSDSLGLHPLLVFAAILVSIKIGGFWGAFFGIPVAGVLWAMVKFFFERWQQNQAANDLAEAMD